MSHPLPPAKVPSPSDHPKPALATEPGPRALRTLYAIGAAMLAACGATTAILVTWRTTTEGAQRQERSQRVDQGPRVHVSPVVTSCGVRNFSLPGDVRSMHAATLYAKIAGYLGDILVDKGDKVEKGQLLASIASPETDQQAHQIEADLRIARQTLARLATLVDQGVVSHQEIDVATAAVHAGEANLGRLAAIRKYEALTAPFSGTITARYVDAGALLSAGTSSTLGAQPVIELEDTQALRIYVYVGQAEAPFIKVGDPVRITSFDLPQLSLDTQVTRVAGALDVRTRTMQVEIDVQNQADVLSPGLFVQVALKVKTPVTPMVPSEAIFLRKGVTYAAVIDQNVAKFVRVKLGFNDGSLVQVLDGLKAGQSVGLHVGDEILDNSRVRPVEPRHPKISGQPESQQHD